MINIDQLKIKDFSGHGEMNGHGNSISNPVLILNFNA